ncbi:hypothetical protein [Campylobacter taeniopygiae]|uniref:Uncharacterized protein n=1 Tax=Campylobacter taeniopygiae TaxID=2510188 RepID=A0ABY2THU1_9BACT|nr:hypothetical protein [Campylobacter taeniopygiae]TKX33676.1 hypothetical protein CQA75_05880 [Campylobacter taeniopygiae]
MLFAIFLGLFVGILFFGGYLIGFYIYSFTILAIFALLNYFIRINIKEFVKSYFLTFFIIFLITIIIGFYITYGVDNVEHFVPFMNSPEVEKLSLDGYRIYIYMDFLSCLIFVLVFLTLFIILCLLQAYFFKCYSTGEKRKKISWFIGFICNISLIASCIAIIFEDINMKKLF